MTYIDMFITGSSFNEMAYSNPKYDDLVAKSKGELLKDDAARWKALAEAEKIFNWSRLLQFLLRTSKVQHT